MTIAVRRLNYQHLLYFWAVVRSGSLTRACEGLHLSAPTVSAQLRTFEERLGQKLLAKSGRRLVPTEVGRVVFSYSDETFALGGDLLNALARRPTQRPLRLVVCIDDVPPKEIAQRLLTLSSNCSNQRSFYVGKGRSTIYSPPCVCMRSMSSCQILL